MPTLEFKALAEKLKNRFIHGEVTSLEPRGDYDCFIRSSSDTIRIARVLCIFLMCYVHTRIGNLNPLIESLIADVLGRSSVPLLSVISGLLMVGYFRQTFSRAIGLRFKSLIIPMIFWGVSGSIIRYIAGDIDEIVINDIIPISAPGNFAHLAFLRDLFLLMVATPFLILALKKTSYTVILLIAVGLMMPPSPILLRPEILSFYAVGLFLGLYKIPDLRSLDAIILVIFILTTIGVVFWNWKGEVFNDLILRPICAWAFWIIALFISATPWRSVFIKVEPVIFLLFLSHPLVGLFVRGVYGKAQLNIDTAFWLVIPLICLAVAFLGKRILAISLMPKIVPLCVVGKQNR